VGPEHRANQSPLLQIAEMIFTQATVHPEQIALRVVLLLEILRRLDAGHPAEVVLADDAHPKLFGFAQLLTFLSARKPLCPDDHHRRARGDLVGGGTAETNHKGVRLLAAERREFAGEHNDLVGEWSGR